MNSVNLVLDNWIYTTVINSMPVMYRHVDANMDYKNWYQGSHLFSRSYFITVV